MNFTNFEIIMLMMSGAIFIAMVVLLIFAAGASKKIKNLESAVARQNSVLSKMSGAFRAKVASDAIAQNAEIIYQDMLQNIAPIVAALEIKPRDTNEHDLWRSIGGLLDEYTKNPFVLEQLRRLIKLDSASTRKADAFLMRGEQLLHHLSNAVPDGLLAATFTDGLLGQAMTLLAQAKQLANAN